MYYQEKIIAGYEKTKNFLAKFRPGTKWEMCECIGHCGDVTVELLCCVPPQGWPTCYYWLRLPASEGAKWARSIYDINERRHEIYEGIRLGEIAGRL